MSCCTHIKDEYWDVGLAKPSQALYRSRGLFYHFAVIGNRMEGWLLSQKLYNSTYAHLKKRSPTLFQHQQLYFKLRWKWKHIYRLAKELGVCLWVVHNILQFIHKEQWYAWTKHSLIKIRQNGSLHKKAKVVEITSWEESRTLQQRI